METAQIKFLWNGLYESRSGAVAVALGGRESVCRLDDSYQDAYFDVRPDSPLWAPVKAAYDAQEQRRSARIAKRGRLL